MASFSLYCFFFNQSFSSLILPILLFTKFLKMGIAFLAQQDFFFFLLSLKLYFSNVCFSQKSIPFCPFLAQLCIHPYVSCLPVSFLSPMIETVNTLEPRIFVKNCVKHILAYIYMFIISVTGCLLVVPSSQPSISITYFSHLPNPVFNLLIVQTGSQKVITQEILKSLAKKRYNLKIMSLLASCTPATISSEKSNACDIKLY